MKFKEFCKAALPDTLICIVDGIFNGRTMSCPHGPRYWLDSDYAENEVSRFKVMSDGTYAVSFKEERVAQVSIDIRLDADYSAATLEQNLFVLLEGSGYDVCGIDVNQSWSLEEYEEGAK